MSGKLIPPPTAAHVCQGRPPADSIRRAGMIWKCDDCGKESVIVVGAQYNETYYAWRDANGPTYEGESRGTTWSSSDPEGENHVG